MQRYLPIALIVIVLAVGGYLLWSEAGSGMEKYQSSTQGIRFSYPNSYELTQERERDAERPWHVIVLADKDTLPAPQNGEGPPVIAIVIFDNVQGQSLQDWVRTSTFSNFQLSAGGQPASTTVDGEEAITYRYSGLYETEAIAAVKGDKIYLFSVGWLEESDKIRRDFDAIMQNVEFI